ncbi:hypothetical protein ACT3SQ_10120 [Brachybacterium sp. AOP42-C2-15]|uniref:hypothetical protein n=1 Tax=unclassified Brachybacterium TaxID=2623841 RepID=UPI0040344738
MREGFAQTNAGAAALVPGGRPEEQSAADGAEPSARAERRRLQHLAGVTVLGSDEKTVGRVRDIYQQDASGELAAITVMPRQLSSRSVLIPSAAIAALPAAHPTADAASVDAAEPAEPAEPAGAAEPAQPAGAANPAGDAESADPPSAEVVRLRIDAATAKAGLRPPDTGHASPTTLREAEVAVGLDTDAADADEARGTDSDSAVASDADPRRSDSATPDAADAPGTRKAAEDA